MNCVILDDEPAAIQLLSRYVEKVPFLYLVKTFEDPIEAMLYFQQNCVDLLFLDINMPDINGIEFSKILSTKAKIIFTTAHSEFALQGFDVNATDYLLKPFSFERFFKACCRVFDNLLVSTDELIKVSDYIFVKSGTSYLKIYYHDIVYVESRRNNLIIQTKGEEILIYGSLVDFIKKLPPILFIRIHKSFLINKELIKEANIEEVILSHEQKKYSIPIGYVYKGAFLEFLKNKSLN